MRRFSGPLFARWLVLLCGAIALGGTVGGALGQTIPESGRLQIQALEEEKAGRTPVQQKIDSQLLYAAKELRGELVAGGKTTVAADVQYLQDARVLVDIKGDVTPALLAAIARAGGTVVNSFPRFRAIRAKIFVQRVEEIAVLPEVRIVRRAAQAQTNSQTSEGDKAHATDIVRSNSFATGLGVKVGVLSDSIDSLSGSYLNGDLANVTVLSNQGGSGSGEGTAMLEIIHDLAPDAQLYFATAFDGEASFAQNILDLRAAGCNIIVDDVSYANESPFQDDIIAQAVNDVTAAGALYFSSAGNSGNKNDNTSGTWEGDFADGGPATAPVNGRGGRIHSFGLANYNACTNGGSSRNVSLFWADPLGAATDDYDVYVLDSTGSNVLRSSTTTQNGTQDPWEFIGTLNVNERIVVVKASGAARFLHLDTGRARLAISTEGSIAGHSAAVAAFSVAAVWAGTSYPNAFSGGAVNPVETFSSDGPRRIFYTANGTAITPGNFLATGGTVRQKPDLAAADGVTTGTPGFSPFYGTSAAAPHAAGIAALLKSYRLSLSAAEMRTALIAGCLDIEGNGVDRDSGAGLLLATNVLQTVPAPAAARHVVADGLSLVSETVVPANSQIDPGEVVTVALTLTNRGGLATSDLVATLLTEAGVTQPSAAQNYGVLAAAGGSASRQFTFRANGPLGGTNLARLQLNDGATNLGRVEFTFNLGLGTPTTTAFSGGAAIAIPESGASTPYPSTLNVSGSAGLISKVTVTLTGFTHTYPSDVGALLVGPSGQKVLLFSGAGGSTAINGVNLTLDDGATASLSATGAIASGTYKPGFGSAPNFTSPAPRGPYATGLSAFAGTNANGTWQLYVLDAFTPDSGTVGSWSLSVTTSVPGSAATGSADLAVTVAGPPAALLNKTGTIVAVVRNNGPAAGTGVIAKYTVPAGVTYGSSSASQGTAGLSNGVVTANLGTLASGAAATLTLNVTPTSGVVVAHSVSVTTAVDDADRTNNSATLYLPVGSIDLAPYQPAGWSDKIVLPAAADSFTDSPTFTSSGRYYLAWPATNNGTLASGAGFSTAIYLDGSLYTTASTANSLSAESYTYWAYSIPVVGPLAPGQHTIRVVVDSGGEVAESDEANNEYTKTFTVTGPNLPDLTPYQPSTWSDKIVLSVSSGTTVDGYISTGSPINLDWASINAGPGVSNATLDYQIYIDGTLRNTWESSPPLNAGYYINVTDYAIGALPIGTHTARLVVDSAAAEGEMDEGNNEYTKTFVVGGPHMMQPTSNLLLDDSLTVEYELEQAAQAGSVTLTLDDGVTLRTLTLTNDMGTAGYHYLNFTPSHPMGEISGPAIPSGVYKVTLSFRDVSGNGPATAVATNVTIDAQTGVPTLSAPASNSILRDNIGVLFKLPEAAFSGTVKLIFSGQVGQQFDLANNQGTVGFHGFNFNPGSPTSTPAISAGNAIPDGVYSVELRYRDALGNNESTATATNIRIDRVPPTFYLLNPIVAEATEPGGAFVNYGAGAEDPTGGGLASSSFVPASGSLFPLGTTTVQASATDLAGNSATGSFTITVRDTTNPQVTPPANLTAEATSTAGVVVNYPDGTVFDAVGVTEVNYSKASGTLFAIGSTTVTITAKDAATNTGSASFTVTVKDTNAPTVTPPADIVAEAASPNGTVVSYPSATATDSVSGPLAVSYSKASNTVFPIGITTVIASATDGANNTGTASFKVKIQDTIKPAASVAATLKLAAGPNGTVLLGDLQANVTRSDAASIPTVTQTPGATMVVGLGDHTVVFKVEDPSHNFTVVSTTVKVAFERPGGPETTPTVHAGPIVKKSATGDLVPAGSGLLAEATLGAFFPPAVSDVRQMAARVTVLNGKKKLDGIYIEDGAGEAALPAFQTGPANGFGGSPLGEVTYKTFEDPVISPEGALAFSAKLQGAGAKGVDAGVWSDLFSSTPLQLRLVLQKGMEVPGIVGGGKLKSLTSLSLRTSGLLTLVKLAPEKGVVTTKDDTALVLVTDVGAGTQLLRKGRELSGTALGDVKSFSVLQPALGSAGHGRWHGDDATVAKVTLASGEVALVKIGLDGAVTPLLSSADAAAAVDAAAHWKSLGLPAMGGNGTHFSLLATLLPKEAGISTKDDTVLLYSPDGVAWTAFAREGDPISASSGAPRYDDLFDPVADDAGRVAFLATLQGAGVNAKNKAALFWGLPAGLQIAARLSEPAPDVNGDPTDAVWSKFVSLALPSGEGSGLVFLAETRGGDTTSRNKLALWGVDSQGELRRLLRTGAALTTGGPVVTKLGLLGATRGSYGVTRSFNGTGSLAVLVTFADKTQALVRVDLP